MEVVMKKIDSFGLVFWLYICIIVAGVVGWCMNIYQLVTLDEFSLTGVVIVKIIGIFIAPLGAIMGYFF